jgi:hypothetical protein
LKAGRFTGKGPAIAKRKRESMLNMR